jgi:GT2 family glycosyltransferase
MKSVKKPVTLPSVTLIVVQRERFSLTQPSLDSILADHSYPFQLIYVDGGSPSSTRQYLQEQADQYDCMTLIRCDRYLRANEARNLALPLVKTADYIVFIDNDVIVEPGWLQLLVNCAEEEQAGIVSPLILQGDPQVPEEIEVHVLAVKADFYPQSSGKRRLNQKTLLHCAKLRTIDREFSRISVDAVELHTMLIRRSLMDEIVLDEVFDSLESHLDICLQAQVQGAKIFVEPKARVTFLYPKLVPGINQDELPFYLFKWNEIYIRKALTHAREKWNLESDDSTLWGFWRWAISNRQLPAKWATSDSNLYKIFLNSCKLRLCPSWLRRTVENLVLKLTFPQSGIPLKMKQLPEISQVEAIASRR